MMLFSTSYYKEYAKHWRRPTSRQIARDFVSHFTHFLAADFSMPLEPARCTASAVFARMSNPLLTYHNPLHILSLFDFAAELRIRIRPWEKIALLFHDVIYDPFAPFGRNEKLSAAVAVAMMTGVDKVDLALLEDAILATALHTSGTVDRRFNLILDLDVCAFAWDQKNFAAQSAAVAGEFIPTLGEQRWVSGRDQFLGALLSKGPIYRTPAFRRFEKIAQKNIRHSIADAV